MKTTRIRIIIDDGEVVDVEEHVDAARPAGQPAPASTSSGWGLRVATIAGACLWALVTMDNSNGG